MENLTKRIDLPNLIEPKLVKTARQIYRDYCEGRPNMVERPTGVVINQLTYRGQVVFSNKPIRLPQEYFIQRDQLDSQI